MHVRSNFREKTTHRGSVTTLEIADAIQEFLTGSRAPVAVDSVLATVLFTDIVGSTEKAAVLGDSRWQKLLDKHHTTIRSNLGRFRGQEVKTTGDGFSRLSMARHAVSVALAPLRRKYTHSGLMFAQVCIRARAKSWVKTSAA